MRLCNFCAPKRVKTPKGPKSVPYEIFLFSRWRYPKIMGTGQIWSEPGLSFSIRTDRTIGPKIAPPPKPLFSEGNCKFGQLQSADIKQAAELAKFQIRPTPGPRVTWLRTFGPKNGAMPKTHYATPISRILLGTFVPVGFQPSPENLGQIHLANLIWMRIRA